MQVVCCCLLEEVILQLPAESSWLPVLQEHLILSSLLSSVEYFIKVSRTPPRSVELHQGQKNSTKLSRIHQGQYNFIKVSITSSRSV